MYILKYIIVQLHRAFFFRPLFFVIYIYLQRPTWTADSMIAIGQEEFRVLLIAETAANSAST